MIDKKQDIEGAKAGQSQRKPYIQPDSAASTQTAEIVYGIGEGENGGLINGLQSIILDGTRVMGFNGEINYNEVKYEERVGLIEQEPLTLVEDTATERTVNLEIRDTAPVVSTFNNIDVDKFVVRIDIPQLFENKDNGDSVAASVTYAIDYSIDSNPYVNAVTHTVNEKITNGYQIDHEIDIPAGNVRTIRVRRVTPESTSQMVADRIAVAGITEVIAAKFTHPALHYIGLTFNAEQFNGIPKAVFHYYGRKIRVPSNYNPVTRTYDGIWNGSFKVVYSNNPAWVLYDILTNRRFGLGRRLSEDLIDKWELYSIGVYCDELVPDGNGGMEPRFVCNNLVLNSREDAYQVIKDIASIFRGQAFWNGTQIITNADAPRDVEYAISMSSVKAYSYSGTTKNARHNVIKVQYYDKKNEYKAAYEFATDYDNIRDTGEINELEIRAMACDSPGQAQRLARYTLLSEQTETRILNATVSMDAMINMQIGDIFAWSDKFLAGADNGGRVVAVDGKVITLDRDVTTSALVNDHIYVNTTEGKAAVRTIKSINGDKLTLDQELTNVESEFVWVIDSKQLSLLYFRLDDIKANPAENTVEIVGIQHVNAKFEAIDTKTAIEAPPFSKIEIDLLKAPSSVTLSFNVRVDQGINVADLYMGWGQVKGATRYVLEMRRDNQAWRSLGNIVGLSYTAENVSAGIYEVRVRAVDAFGNVSPFTVSDPIQVTGNVLPPSALASITATGELLAIRVDWSFPDGAEASLATVIEYAIEDPNLIENAVIETFNVPYPQTSYTFRSLAPHAKLWVRGRLLDKFQQLGEPTAWVSAEADADPEALLEIIEGHINEGTLDTVLREKIDDAATGAIDAQAAAEAAQGLANTANAAADNAQATANQAKTDALAAANAAGKAATDLAQEVNNRTTAINNKATELRNEIQPQLDNVKNGITQEVIDRKAGDTAVVGQLNAYKTSNDSAVATVLQKAESAVSASGTNASQILAIQGQITTINNNKLDASVITNYYTKGQADDKAEEIAAGKIEAYDASLVIGGANLLSGTSTDWKTISFGGWQQNLFTNLTLASLGLKVGDTIAISGELTAPSTTDAGLQVTFVGPNSFEYTNFVAAGTTGRAELAISIPVGTTGISLAVGRYTLTGSTDAFKYRKLQLERASKASAWSPSNEDIKGALDANSTAINDTKAEVERVDGRVTTTNSNVTTLSGRVSTVEGAVATKAEAAALNSLTTRVGTVEGGMSSQGTAITNLQNTINHATTGLASKASTAALNSLDSKVTAIDGTVSGHTSQLTNLAGSIATINGTLAGKVDSTTLVNYYTKQQANDEMAAAAAGAVQTYDANLVIGGSNLYTGPNPVVLRNQSAAGRIDFTAGGTGTLQRFNYLTADNFDISSLNKDDPTIASIEVFIPSTTTSDYTIQFGTYKFSAIGYRYAPTVDVKDIPKDTWVKLVTEPGTWPATATETGVNLVFNLAGTRVVGDSFHWRNFMMEKATKASEFKESDKAIQNKIDANSTAIQTTNAEVERVDGKTIVNTNAITGLTSRMNTVEGQVSTKAEASALQNYYTKNEADAKSLTLAAGEVSKYDASLVIGGVNLVPDSNHIAQNNNGPTYTISYQKGDPDKIVNNSNNGGISTYTTVFIPTVIGKSYTVSVKVRPNVDTKLHLYRTGTSTPMTASSSNDCPANVWTTLWFTFTANADSTRLPGFLQSTGFANDVIVEFKEYQFEEGTKVTAWSPSTADVQSALDANAQTINATNAEVVRVEGRVSTNANNINTLTNSINTLSGSKLDASVIAGYYTKGQTDDKIESVSAGKVESLRSSIENATEVIKLVPTTSSIENIYKSRTGLSISLVDDATATTAKVLKISGDAASANVLSLTHVPFNPNKLYRIKYKVKRTAGTGIFYPAMMPLNADKTNAITGGNVTTSVNTITSALYPFTGSTTNAPLDVWKEGTYYIKGLSAGAATGSGSVTSPRTMPNLGAYLRLGFIAPANTDFVVEYFILEEAEEDALASSLSATDTKVERIDGEVKGHTTQLNNLTTDLAGKAASGVVDALTVRVIDVEGKYNTQAQSITNLTSSVNLINEELTIPDTRSTNEAPSWYWSKYPRKIVNEFKQQTAIGVSGFFGGTYCNLQTVVGWSGSSGGHIIQTATSSNDPSLYVQRVSTSTTAWGAWSQPIKDLRDGIAGKADASAVSSLNTRVGEVEGGLSSQASSITGLQASVAGALPKVGGSGSFKTFKEVLNYYLSSSSSSANIVIETPITFSANMFRISGKGYNYASTKSVIDFEVSGYAYQSTGSILQHGAKNAGTFPLRIRLGMKNGKLCVILSPQGTNFAYPAFTLDAAVSYGSVPDAFKDGWSATTVAEASLASSGITAIMEPSLLDVGSELAANASAISTTTAEVSTIKGTVNAHVTAISNLTTTVGNHTTSINTHTSSINGIRGVHALKIETNGVISGYGLVSELVNGQVKSQFGVNADNFFIGAPSNNKKPFVVLTSSGTINGVTVPAGTYIDTAFIANATIKSAQIADAAITNAKISGAIQSNDYVAGSTGWKIDKAGGFEMNGTSSSGKVVIKPGGIYGYYANGKTMFKLGV